MQKFEMLFEKLIKENKLDKNFLIKKLKQSTDLPQQLPSSQQVLSIPARSTTILEEIDSSQFNDVLLDEQILLGGNDSSCNDCDDDQQIAIEAPHHQSTSNENNFYKFRN